MEYLRAVLTFVGIGFMFHAGWFLFSVLLSRAREKITKRSVRKGIGR